MVHIRVYSWGCAFCGLGKCIMLGIHHCGIIQKIITALKIPSVLPVYPSQPPIPGTTDLSSVSMHVKVKVLVAQSHPTLCYPMDCSPPGSCVHGILQARTMGVGCHALQVLASLECPFAVIIEYVAFLDQLVSLNNMHVSVHQVFSWLGSTFLFWCWWKFQCLALLKVPELPSLQILLFPPWSAKTLIICSITWTCTPRCFALFPPLSRVS